jgi:hypothetical protein
VFFFSFEVYSLLCRHVFVFFNSYLQCSDIAFWVIFSLIICACQMMQCMHTLWMFSFTFLIYKCWELWCHHLVLFSLDSGTITWVNDQYSPHWLCVVYAWQLIGFLHSLNAIFLLLDTALNNVVSITPFRSGKPIYRSELWKLLYQAKIILYWP